MNKMISKEKEDISARPPFFKYFNTIDSGHSGKVSMILNINQILFATSSYDTTIKIWESATYSQKYTLQGHTHSIYSLIKITDNIIASGSYDSTIRLWNIDKQQCVKTIKANDVVYYLLYQGDNVLFSGSNECIYSFNIATGECLNKIILIHHILFCLESIIDNIISFGGDNFAVKGYDHKRNLMKFSLVGHTNTIFMLKKLGEDRLISSSDDKTIKIWDMANCQCIATLIGHRHSVWGFKIFKEKYIFSVSWDGKIRLWNIITYQCICIASSSEQIPIYTIELIGDRQIAVGLKNSQIILWNF